MAIHTKVENNRQKVKKILKSAKISAFCTINCHFIPKDNNYPVKNKGQKPNPAYLWILTKTTHKILQIPQFKIDFSPNFHHNP